MPNNTKKEERCAGCGKCTERATTSEQCLKMGDCPCHWSIPSPQSPLSEERWCAKALDNLKEARLQGQRDERERLRQKAIEYKEKGFELETFIYSGFIEDLPTPPTEEVKD